MTNTAARNYNTIEATEIVKNRIREHIREKEAVRSRLRRAIKFLFSCDAANPYYLNPEMQAKLYL